MTIRTYDEFVGVLNENGFMMFCGSGGYLSLRDVTEPSAWHTGGKADPWGWKDRLAERRDGAYAHMLGGNGGFISREWYPAAHAAWAVDIYERYAAGLVPRLAMEMWRLFEARPVWGRHELRRALIGRFERKNEFETALRYLERGMLITISGQVQPVSLSGRPMGWQAMEYARADVYLGDWLCGTEPDAASARQMIRERAYATSPAMTEAEYARCFGGI